MVTESKTKSIFKTCGRYLAATAGAGLVAIGIHALVQDASLTLATTVGAISNAVGTLYMFSNFPDKSTDTTIGLMSWAGMGLGTLTLWATNDLHYGQAAMSCVGSIWGLIPGAVTAWMIPSRPTETPSTPQTPNELGNH